MYTDEMPMNRCKPGTACPACGRGSFLRIPFFDDVVVENIFTTNMPLFLEKSVYRNEIYTKQFPTGSWIGVKELALPELMIEIELEVHKSA